MAQPSAKIKAPHRLRCRIMIHGNPTADLRIDKIAEYFGIPGFNGFEFFQRRREIPHLQGKLVFCVSGQARAAMSAYVSCVSNTSLTPHLSRFRRCSSVFRVTFCSPNSIRCNEDLETPSLRANAGRLKCPRRLLRKRPSWVCKDAAISAVCRALLPTCGKLLDASLQIHYQTGKWEWPQQKAMGLDILDAVSELNAI